MNLFGSAPSPQPKPLPTAPAVDPAQIEMQQQRAAEEQLQASAGGRASTILTGPQGDTMGASKNSVAKMLLG